MEKDKGTSPLSTMFWTAHSGKKRYQNFIASVQFLSQGREQELSYGEAIDDTTVASRNSTIYANWPKIIGVETQKSSSKRRKGECGESWASIPSKTALIQIIRHGWRYTMHCKNIRRCRFCIFSLQYNNLKKTESPWEVQKDKKRKKKTKKSDREITWS